MRADAAPVRPLLMRRVRLLAAISLSLGLIVLGGRQYLRYRPVPVLAVFMPEGWRQVSPGLTRVDVYRTCGQPDVAWGDVKADIWSQPTPLGFWQLSVFYVDGGPIVRQTYVAYYIGNSEHYL